MQVLKTVKEARLFRESLKEAPGFVPTMGALHFAHASLMRYAKETSPYIVSIFVNPTQFGPGGDYSSYPRTLEEDLEICRREGALAVFAPPVEEIYPEGSSTQVVPSALTDTMCGLSRPGHFSGVTTVLTKLFNILRPSKVFFGEKDYQQCRVVMKMIEDLNLEQEMVICPTVREKDGLAVSSRNSYLSQEERSQAPALYAALKKAASMIEAGEEDVQKLVSEIKKIINLDMPLGKMDYVGIYSPDTLLPLTEINGEVLLAAAVHLGQARLIDNIVIRKEQIKL